MPMKGKRKAKVTSPEGPSKRRSAAPAASFDDVSESECTGEEDAGRTESQDMLNIAEVSKRFSKEDPFFAQAREDITADELELQSLIDRKEREIVGREGDFKSQLRALLTSTLSTPAHPLKPTVHVTKNRRVVTTESESTASVSDARPYYDHNQLLFAQGESMIKMYRRAEKAVSLFKGVDEVREKCDKDKAEVGRIIIIGEKVARKRIEEVLQKPEANQLKMATPNRKKKGQSSTTPRKGLRTPQKEEMEALFEDDEVSEIEGIFDGLRQNREEEKRKGMATNDEQEAVSKKVKVGFYPLLCDIEKGAKRMYKHVPLDEDMEADL